MPFVSEVTSLNAVDLFRWRFWSVNAIERVKGALARCLESDRSNKQHLKLPLTYPCATRISSQARVKWK